MLTSLPQYKLGSRTFAGRALIEGCTLRVCNSGEKPVHCRHQLEIRYVNLKNRTDRVQYMESHLKAVIQNDRHRIVRGLPKRVEALRPQCSEAAGQPCLYPKPPDMLTETELQHAASSMEHWPPKRRAGVMGCFLTGLNELRRFGARANSSKFMLLLEDDVQLALTFLSELPCLLAALPADAPWHVVRFGTWGSHYPEDEVRPASVLAPGSKVFRARAFGHTFGVNGAQYAYGGSYAVLVQRHTVNALARHLTGRGIGDFDARLREVAGASIVSYALQTPLVTTQNALQLASDIPKLSKLPGVSARESLPL